MNFFKFWHLLWNPNCQDCSHELHEKEASAMFCESCETLKQTNAELRAQNHLLLNSIIEKNQPERVSLMQEVEPVIKPRHIPWSVRREALEEQARNTAKILRDRGFKPSKVEELEKELLVDIPEYPLVDDVNENAR